MMAYSKIRRVNYSCGCTQTSRFSVAGEAPGGGQFHLEVTHINAECRDCLRNHTTRRNVLAKPIAGLNGDAGYRVMRAPIHAR